MPQTIEEKKTPEIHKRYRVYPWEGVKDPHGYGYEMRHWFANPARGGMTIRDDKLAFEQDEMGRKTLVHSGFRDTPVGRSDPQLNYDMLVKVFRRSATKGISLLHAFVELNPDAVTKTWLTELETVGSLDFADPKYGEE